MDELTSRRTVALGLTALAFGSVLGLPRDAAAETPRYPWFGGLPNSHDTIERRFPTPRGFRRVDVRPMGYAAWLRGLPLKPAGAKVMLHNGRRKPNQGIHAAVVDLDIGRRDLQQCADAVMRLRAEYLYSRRRYEAIAFNFTSGDRAIFNRWAEGWRPKIAGRRVRWIRNGRRGRGYANFRSYLTSVFTYAGSYSLSRELKRVPDPSDIRIGDMFVQGGFPGHAIIVVDMAEEKRGGRKLFLLAQSYMPAQSLHILKNIEAPDLGAWYALPADDTLPTPEWTFKLKHLRRF